MLRTTGSFLIGSLEVWLYFARRRKRRETRSDGAARCEAPLPPDNDDSYEFGADTAGRIAALALWVSWVRSLTRTGTVTGRYLNIQSKGAPASAPEFGVTKA